MILVSGFDTALRPPLLGREAAVSFSGAHRKAAPGIRSDAVANHVCLTLAVLDSIPSINAST